jgi:hypothetical protein
MGFAATPDGMLYVFGGVTNLGNVAVVVDVAGVEGAGCMGLRHAACTCRTAALSLLLAEGTKVGREKTCRLVCHSTYAAAEWAV